LFTFSSNILFLRELDNNNRNDPVSDDSLNSLKFNAYSANVGGDPTATLLHTQNLKVHMHLTETRYTSIAVLKYVFDKVIRQFAQRSIRVLSYQYIKHSLADKLPVLFILCPDLITEMKVKLLYSHHINISQIIKPITYTFSPNVMGYSYFYTNIIQEFTKDIMSRQEFIPWIGTISSHDFARLSNIHDILNDPQQSDMNDIQVIPLGRPSNHDGVFWDEQEICCPDFIDLFKRILMSRGESEEKVLGFINLSTSSNIIESFHGSSFMFRPNVLTEYILWLSNMWVYILTDPFIQQSVWNSCKYRGKNSFQNTNHTSMNTQPGFYLLDDLLNAYYLSSRDYKFPNREISKISAELLTNRTTLHNKNSCSGDDNDHPYGFDSMYILPNQTVSIIQQG